MNSGAVLRVAITLFFGFALGFAARGMSESAYAMKRGDHLGDRLVKALELNHDQESQVRVILNDAQNEIGQLRSDIRPRFLELQGRTRTKIETLLSPEQKQAFTEFQAKLEQKRLEKQNDTGVPFPGAFRSPF